MKNKIIGHEVESNDGEWDRNGDYSRQFVTASITPTTKSQNEWTCEIGFLEGFLTTKPFTDMKLLKKHAEKIMDEMETRIACNDKLNVVVNQIIKETALMYDKDVISNYNQAYGICSVSDFDKKDLLNEKEYQMGMNQNKKFDLEEDVKKLKRNLRRHSGIK